MELEKYSFGLGDRFGVEGAAQLRAVLAARERLVHIVPVWNKSNREHSIIGTGPEDTRREADAAVKTCKWQGAYYVDADHINLGSVDRFIGTSDFFTIDVADQIGKQPTSDSLSRFLKAMNRFRGKMEIPGMRTPLEVTNDLLVNVAQKYLCAIEEAGTIYRRIAGRKGAGNFVTEVSVDEAGSPQTPAELLLILAAVAHEEIPVQTIAPKFTGSFLKGVDYVGDIDQFAREFEDNLAVLAYAVKAFSLPRSLKLSIHSGSDKFSLYPLMHAAIRKFDAGLHIKTAGTTWLEEVIGLAASGGEGLSFAKEIYAKAFGRYGELCGPYATVIHIDRCLLPDPSEVAALDAPEFVRTLQHNPREGRFNPHVRQLVHIGYKVAAEMRDRFSGLLRDCRSVIEANVTANLYHRHIVPLFLGQPANTMGSRPEKEDRVEPVTRA